MPLSPNTIILPAARPAPLKRKMRRWLRYHQQTVMVVALTGIVGVTALVATVGLVSTLGARIPAATDTSRSLATTLQ